MQEPSGLEVLFVAGYAAITRDDRSKKLYWDTFKLPLKEENGYAHTGELDGLKHFGLWPLSHAAESCFGKAEWPKDVPVPQGCLEFEVADVAKATKELESKGYRLLVKDKTEPWGQVVTRLLAPEGLLIGLTFTPWMREKK
jgi:glyoxalase/bleomycin resistance protein/dioxygenase superfamily protein